MSHKKENKNDGHASHEEHEPKDHIDELLDEEELESELDEVVIDEVQALKAELDESKHKLLRYVADTENYQKRLQKETDDKVRFANQSLLIRLLAVVDNFDLALSHKDGVDLQTFIDGVELNRRTMMDILGKSGLMPIDTKVGDPFDPEIHEAINLVSDENLPDNSVAMIFQSGYKLDGRVVRTMKVQVNKLN